MSNRAFDWNFILNRSPFVACQRVSAFTVPDEEMEIGRWDHFSGERYLTTSMLKFLIDHVEVVDEWPACVITLTRKNAECLQGVMIDMLMERNMAIDSVKSGRITLRSGAEYNFIRKESLDRWMHGHGMFSYILEDNEVYEDEHSRILRHASDDRDFLVNKMSWIGLL